MTIYPAIDIKGGRCVRLTQGRADQQTVYAENPADVAAEFRAAVLADGADTAELTPDQFAQVIKSDIQRYAKLAKTVGMSVD